MPSESELLQRAHRLESLALAQIYDQYSPVIFRYARRLLGSSSLAEDCVADIFSRLLSVLHEGRGPREHLQAYLYRSAHNWITDQYRKGVPEEPLDDGLAEKVDTPEELTAKRFRRSSLRAAIQNLTPDQQQVIALKFLEDLKNDEIARIMGKPLGAVKSLQHRALASLQRMLETKELL